LERLIEEAKQCKVRESVIEEALKTIESYKYAKYVEEQIIKAVAEKNWPTAKELYLKATTQHIKIDQKVLNDCKNQLTKQKVL